MLLEREMQKAPINKSTKPTVQYPGIKTNVNRTDKIGSKSHRAETSRSIYIWIERHGIGSADATQFIEIKLHFIYLFIHFFIHLYDLGIHRGVARTGSRSWCGTPPT
jgi:hypothetical protein